jgi:membrane protein DedA with SNARE-associated domain
LLFVLERFFYHHIYTAVLLATVIEGMGLPLPAEVLFVVAALMIHRGAASLGGVVFAASLGNVMGTMLGFSLAYMGGQTLVSRIASTVRLKPEAMQEVERFFHKYGAATIFISRFVGFIRAAAIYSAGAHRISPWRFALYTLSASVIWNAGWAYLAYRFGGALPIVVRRYLYHGLVWAIGAVAVLVVLFLVVRWVRRRDPAGP